MTNTSDITQIVATLKDTATAGFAMAFHIKFTTPTFLLQSYPADWIAFYSQNGLVMQDPTVHWGFENIGMIDWADLRSKDPADVISKAAEHGMAHGITYAVNEGDSLTVTSFARSDRPFSAQERDTIMSGVNAIHMATLTDNVLNTSVLDDLKRMAISATLS